MRKQYRRRELVPTPDTAAAPNTGYQMEYFIPEWDDRVDPGYDFINDIPTPNRDTYEDEIYAHEIYPTPNYDGILVSKVVVEKSDKKKARLEQKGIHSFIRFPGRQIMGDCGAFGYINEEFPPFQTSEILEYYQRLGFDYGVSIDHLIVGPYAEPGIREKRRDLTLKNAEEFIQKHQYGGYSFHPIGAVQGWDPKSYADGVSACIDMGYDFIALGGLARARSDEILLVLEAVKERLTPETRLHLFGVARLNAVPAFRHLGITSFDSASALRRAWLDPKTNYHAVTGGDYVAIRIPSIAHKEKAFSKKFTSQELKKLKQSERNALDALREFDAGAFPREKTLHIVLEHEKLLTEFKAQLDPDKPPKRPRFNSAREYDRLLRDKPWKECDCPICQNLGIDVVIFRGNNRNRRRGFHNTYVFYKQFQEL
jgi:queuine/archaeosine tRNA-ribosyltransferase